MNALPSRYLTASLFIAMHWVLMASCAPREPLDDELSLRQMKKYIISHDVGLRERVISELYKFDFGLVIDDASDRELMSLLFAGLSDRAATVRVVALQSTASQVARIAQSSYAEKLEKVLRHLCTENTEVAERDGGHTTIQIEALWTLRRLKFYRMPFPSYILWENQFFKPEVERLAASENDVHLCGAAKLTVGLTGRESVESAMKILRQLLHANGESVRRAALWSVWGLGQDADRPYGVLMAASLISDLQQIAEEDPSPKCRKLAKDFEGMIEITIQEIEQVIDLEIKPTK